MITIWKCKYRSQRINNNIILFDFNFYLFFFQFWISDDTTTSVFVLGGTIGEALVPIIIGQLMKAFDAEIMVNIVYVMIILMVILYGIIHFSFFYKWFQSSADRTLYKIVSVTEENESTQNLWFPLFAKYVLYLFNGRCSIVTYQFHSKKPFNYILVKYLICNDDDNITANR